MICKTRTKFSEFEENGSRIKRFWKPEGSDVAEALLKWFNLLKPTGYVMQQQV